MSPKLITAPTEEPIALDEAKLHLRADSADDDTLIEALIVAAREGAEHITGRALMPQTWEMALDGFQDVICLPKSPLMSIVSIKYADPSGDVQTLADGAWWLDSYSEPAKLSPAYGASWPATRCQSNAVLIRFQAGYANAESVPQAIKQWMLLQIGAMYENRESVGQASLAQLPFADRLLDPYRVWSL
jgi:uncharacterized phiE125 gp8 family phage protein